MVSYAARKKKIAVFVDEVQSRSRDRLRRSSQNLGIPLPKPTIKIELNSTTNLLQLWRFAPVTPPPLVTACSKSRPSQMCDHLRACSSTLSHIGL